MLRLIILPIRKSRDYLKLLLIVLTIGLMCEKIQYRNKLYFLNLESYDAKHLYDVRVWF